MSLRFRFDSSLNRRNFIFLSRHGWFRRVIFLGLVLIVSTTHLSCGQNIYQPMSNKGTESALYYEALLAMDRRDWDAAINAFSRIKGELNTRRDFIGNKAGAYAGRCGLNFITYFNYLTTLDLTGTTLFKELMNSVSSTSVLPADCAVAETLMLDLGTTAAERTNDENLFFLVLSMFKVGAYLKQYLDVDADGEATAGINVCTVGAANSAGNSAIPSSAMIQIATGFSHLINTFSAFPSFPAAVVTAVNVFTSTMCTFMGEAAVSGNPCAVYDANNTRNSMTTNEFQQAVNTVRDMLKTGPSSTFMPLGVQEAADSPCDPALVVDPTGDGGASRTGFRACCPFAPPGSP